MDDVSPEFAFSSLRDAATQLLGASRTAGVDLHPLPYSRFSPEDTTWWLSPVSENPAFAYGKIVVERPSVVDPDAPIVGLHVEKGVGPSAASIFEETARGRRLVMERDWLWHAFSRGMKSGAVEKDLVSAEEAAAGLPLVVEIVASLQWPPRMDGDEDRPVDPNAVERAWYRPDGGLLTLIGRETPQLLQALATHETLPSIASKIEGMKNADWAWVEILVGVPIRSVPSGGLPASEVWRRVCAPWLPWVR